jgi:hypothetical protein
MTTVNLSLFAGAGGQFFDNNGVPLAGGLLYTYQAGTSSNLTTYTSQSGSIANPNPIVLDAGGRVPNEIWLIGGDSYKFVLQSAAAVLVGTWDNIPGANSISYPISVANGGTSSTSLTANAVVLGNGTSPLQVVPAGTSGNLLIDNGTTWASTQLVGSLATSGYQTLPGGLIIQWGTVTATTSGATFTFPLAFPHGCYICTATNTAGASSSAVISTGTPSVSAVTVYSETGSVSASVIAIGH